MTVRDDPLAVALFSELLIADQLARAQLSRALPKGMELSHFMVLNQLARVGERSPAQLARSAYVTRGAMTNTLAKLETAGHIHIRPDWDDARRKLVAISTAGRAAWSSGILAITPLLDNVSGDLGQERIRAVLPVLRALRMKLERDPNEDS